MVDPESHQLLVVRNRATGETYVSVVDLVAWLETFDLEDELMDQIRLISHEAATGEPIMTMQEIDE